MPLSVSPCDPEEHGTTILLADLNHRFSLPSTEALKELLALEFGRYPGFTITVNSEPLTQRVFRARSYPHREFARCRSVAIRFTIMESPKGAKHARIVTRVGEQDRRQAFLVRA